MENQQQGRPDLGTLEQIDIDYTNEILPSRARKLKPEVFKDGDYFYCLYGPDPEVGIYGSGQTVLEAVVDWEKDLHERMDRLTGGDDAAHHAIKHLGQH